MHEIQNIQTPYVEADFWAQWSSTTPRQCLIVKATPQEAFGGAAAAIGFTSNTRDMTLPGHPGITFKSTPGIAPTAVEQALDEPTNLEMMGIYIEDSFEHAEVIAGKWNFASIQVFSVCWDNVNLGEFHHFGGNMGELKDYQDHFNAEARGKISRLSNEVNKVTSRFCRCKKFRDEECGHTASTVTIDGDTWDIEYFNVEAISAIGNELEIDSSVIPAGVDDSSLLVNGEIECTSGQNYGVSREIVTLYPLFPGHRLVMKRPFPRPVASGDKFKVTAGCDHTLERCMIFENVINRRAEDYIPGLESVNRIPPST